MSLEHNTREDLLKSIRNLLAEGNNGRICVGYQTVSVTNSAVVRLTVPSNAMSAEITVEAVSSSNANAAIRYTVDGTTPVTGSAGGSSAGVPVGEFDTIEILNHTNLNAFRAIAVDAASTKYLKVQYFM